MLESSWFLYISLLLTLAADRLLCFIYPTRRNCLVSSLIVASWVLGISTLVVLCLPDFGYTYNAYESRLGWTFYHTFHGALVMAMVEGYLDLAFSGITLILYFALFLYIAKMRNSWRKVSKTEIRVLLVAFMTFAYDSCFTLLSFWGISFPSNPEHRRIMMNLLWTVNAGLFSLMSMVSNKTLRKKLIKIAIDCKAQNLVKVIDVKART
ncbi:hypothetical protein L596_021806 [Steinernema carpocapsae]|uniref:G-protein coupled receptors family 1 profile domain-containing protein n=1 Tax=Steinernema carpocapsae TaxID=34508 RepID=A0A4U5MJU1_STECR|nr:hypothetical protein L596_021806 [Steinernema carpocapsae]